MNGFDDYNVNDANQKKSYRENLKKSYNNRRGQPGGGCKQYLRQWVAAIGPLHDSRLTLSIKQGLT